MGIFVLLIVLFLASGTERWHKDIDILINESEVYTSSEYLIKPPVDLGENPSDLMLLLSDDLFSIKELSYVSRPTSEAAGSEEGI